MILQPGDVLLYKPSGLYGWLIRVKTWHPIAHVEIAMGLGRCAASRDGQGVNYYPPRLSGLVYILRPKVPFDLPAATRYVDAMCGTPYGWLDLLAFVGLSSDHRGIVCSPFVTSVLRAGGVQVFNREPAIAIAPFQFLDSELLLEVPLDEPAAVL